MTWGCEWGWGGDWNEWGGVGTGMSGVGWGLE